ncbi:MAG: FAD-dependent oxidoreductase [Planctomycetes bacterium]|nr:FAD-dependent oxidoreductase [Planctomycetota bacterium]
MKDPLCPDVVVVGAGIAGLTAALELCARGASVRVWSRDDPKHTTSAVAGAIWYPFLAEPRERIVALGEASLRHLKALAADPATGVHLEPVVEVFRGPPDLWWSSSVSRPQLLPPDDVPLGYDAAVRLEVPICDAPVFLAWLVDRLAARGVQIERRELASIEPAFAVADTVVNCSGLGARELCGDSSLFAVRGQVLVCEDLPVDAAWIDDTGARPSYFIPRRGELIVGGTAQHDDARLEPDGFDTAAILAGVAHRLPALGPQHVRAARVGMRPCRPSLRLEAEDLPGGRRLVHDYGHGGSGFTIAHGCAEVVADLVLAPRE